MKLVIAIDGPAGSGKSTIAKKIAQFLKIDYIDTGAMYRALTLKIIDKGIKLWNKDEILKMMKKTSIDFRENHIYLDGIIVDDKIRQNIISNNVSHVAKIKEVRKEMVKLQRALADKKSIVMDGRDIGTVVLPNADFKFFIIASIEERAKRRYNELIEKGESSISYNQILTEIENRDIIDTTREISPLKKSNDAIIIDTTNKTIEQSVDEVICIIEGR